MQYPQKYLRSKQERLSDSFPPLTHGGRKGSGSSAQAFISVLLHNCAVPLQNSSRFQHDQTHGRRLGKRQGKGMCLALGYAANQWQRWEENLQVPAEPLPNPYEAPHSCHSSHILFETWNAAASQADHPAQHTTCFLMIPSPSRVHRQALWLFLASVSRGFKISGNHAHHAQHIHWPVVFLFGSLP